MQWLTFTGGPHAGKRVELSADETTLGRRATADVRLDEPAVSRIHAIIARRGGVAIIEDLGSHNGTFVNGERIAYHRPLNHGDRIQIGESTILFEDAMPSSEDATLILESATIALHAFTQRQLQVLRLAARGLANKEIARRLAVSERTVKAYLTSVYDKLNVTNRSAAITTALRLGLIDLPSGDPGDDGG